MLERAWEDALEVSKSAPSIMKNIAVNLKDGFIMTMGILPSIMSVGLIGIVLAKFTPIFDWISYIFYPFTWLLQLPEADLGAKRHPLVLQKCFTVIISCKCATCDKVCHCSCFRIIYTVFLRFNSLYIINRYSVKSI